MITIYKNPNGDTRTASKEVTFSEFQKANDMHRSDVKRVMHALADMIQDTGERHDYTKKMFERLFYQEFKSTLEDGTDFVSGDWYRMHSHKERHHLLSYCPDDVNLIDILEMIVDCTCAGLARSGEVRELEINNDILSKAVQNTVELIKSMVKVKEME